MLKYASIENSNVTKQSHRENFVFSQSKFTEKIVNNLNSLRLNDGRFCDLKIIAEDKTFKVHRAVLAASSPYFYAMFNGELLEKNQHTVELHGITSVILEQIIDFIYSGRVPITQDNVQDLFVAADMLELTEIMKGCTNFLVMELQPHNCIGIYSFADRLNATELKTESEKYIHRNFCKVCHESEIFQLEKEILLRFLSSEYLRIDSELQVFDLALNWINSDLTNRRPYVFEILQHVRISLISFAILKERIAKSCEDCSLKIALKSIYNDLADKKGCLVPLNVKPRINSKKDIYVIGGSKREKKKIWDGGLAMFYVGIEKFDTFKKEWHQVPNMTIDRLVPGVAALNGHIYVVGGEKDSDILASCERYDPQENQWTMIASMNVPRCDFGLCAIDGYLYAMGGWVDEADMCDSIERYDPKLDVWDRVGNLPEPRFSMGLVCYDGLIYMVGGRSASKRSLKDLMSYNPSTGEWKALVSMTTPRFQMGVAVLDDHLYVVGGTNKQEMLDSVERYSFKHNKWSPVTSMKVERSGPAVASVNGLLYVIGGTQTHKTEFYRAQCTISSVEYFDPMTNSWTDCPPLSETRAEAGAVVI